MEKFFIAFATLFWGIAIGLLISFFAFNHPSNLEKHSQETIISSGRYLRIIEFNGHSYVFLRNSWNSAGDQLFHDPSCKCLTKV